MSQNAIKEYKCGGEPWSINLLQVTAAKADGPSTTTIWLSGGPNGMKIECPYAKFVKEWQDAKA